MTGTAFPCGHVPVPTPFIQPTDCTTFYEAIGVHV